MEIASKNATELLEALLHAREAFGEMVNEARARPGVVYARPFVRVAASPFRVHREGVIEEYVSAVSVGASVKHSNESEVFWAVDICWNEKEWTILASVEIDRDGALERVKDFEPIASITLADCISALKNATMGLQRHADAVNLLST